MLEGKSWLIPSKHTHLHGQYVGPCTIKRPDTAKRLTVVLKFQVRNVRSSPENILKFSPQCDTGIKV